MADAPLSSSPTIFLTDADGVAASDWREAAEAPVHSLRAESRAGFVEELAGLAMAIDPAESVLRTSVGGTIQDLTIAAMSVAQSAGAGRGMPLSVGIAPVRKDK